MRIAGDKEAPRVARSQCKQEVILQATETNVLVIWKESWKKTPGLDPAASPRRWFQRDQSANELVHTADTASGYAAQQLTGNHRGEPHREVADLSQDLIDGPATAEHIYVHRSIKEGDH
jgi:hypothetical protein